ncbi:MAG: DUF1800 domain-containing protein [Bacteroidota bacterium]
MDRLIHRYNRFGFGLYQKELDDQTQLSFDRILKRKRIVLSETDLNEFRNKGESDRKELRKLAGKKMNTIRREWMNAMMYGHNFIHEKMVLFWHHHFACEIKNPLYAVQFSNHIRKNAMGDFKELLKGIARSAAMIAYLNNRQNKKASPNENFARELCELFTLGRDVLYDENDIKEIARAFTGWRTRFDGTFFVNQKHHDNGRKKIFGLSGEFDGDEVLRIILERKECAYFICENLYTFFVHPVVDKERVKELGDYFYRHDYNIESLLRYIVNSEWFYHNENVMCRIKSPVELLVGIGRQIDLRSTDDKAWMKIQRIFDQVLYKPRNVEGWKVNQEWIDSNSLPLRMRLASWLLNDGMIEFNPKHDYDSNPNFIAKRNAIHKLGLNYKWEIFEAKNEGADFKALYFNNHLSEQAASFLKSRKYNSIKEEVIQLMSLPEYQLM